MKKALLILLGLAGMLCAEEGEPKGVTSPTPSPTPQISWTNVPKDCWGDQALPYAQAGLKAWYQETDPNKKNDVEFAVAKAASRADAPDIMNELLAGKPMEQFLQPVPTNAVSLTLTAIKEWDIPQHHSRSACEIRRVGPKNIELWTAQNGWLFDETGTVIAEAKIPRHDKDNPRFYMSWDEDWYGAFLANGQWITTELWDWDRRLYIFSSSNHLLRAFPIKKYAYQPGEEHYGNCRAMSARADRFGSQWIVEIEAEANCGLLVSPWCWQVRVAEILRRFHISYPRSWALVERMNIATTPLPRNSNITGFVRDFTVHSDDLNGVLTFGSPGHGPGIDWIHYSFQSPVGAWDHYIPNSERSFGFFPSSLVAWVCGSYGAWIISPSGKALGKVDGIPVGDDPDGKRMWFADEQGRLLKVAPDGKVSEVLQPNFLGAKGDDAPFAQVLFPDLKLGFFNTKPGHLVLARWK